MTETMKEFAKEYQNMREWAVPKRIMYLEELYQKKDYAAMLAENLGNMSAVMIAGRPFEEAALELLECCSEKEKQQHPISLLQIAYYLYGMNNIEAADRLMKEIQSYIGEKTEPQLLGEWKLVSMFRYFPDISKMLPILKEAVMFMEAPSQVIRKNEPFFYGIPGIFGLIWKEPGTLPRLEKEFLLFLKEYRKVAHNGGSGSDTLFKAEVAFQRGEINQAEQYCYKAIYQTQAAGQEFLLLGALHVIGQIHIHLRKRAEFVQIFQQMNLAAHLHPENGPMAGKIFDYCSGVLMLELNFTESFPEWLIIRNQIGLPYKFSSLGMDHLYVRWAFARREYNRGLGIALGWLEEERSSLLLANVVRLYAASALWKLGAPEEAQSLVKESLLTLEKDQVLLAVASFYYAQPDMIDPVLNQMSKETYQHVHKLLKEYDHNWQKTFYYLLTNAHEHQFSKRERELTELVVGELSNKEIAERLGITERTVKFHLTQIYKKLGLKNRKQLIEIIMNQE